MWGHRVRVKSLQGWLGCGAVRNPLVLGVSMGKPCSTFPLIAAALHKHVVACSEVRVRVGESRRS